MGFVLNSPGPTTILNTTSTGPGNWYRVLPRYGKLTIQVIHTGTSLGTTVQSTTYIQASNDGVNPLQTTAGTSVDALATLVNNGGSPQSNGFTLDAAWSYIRANLNSISTGTVQVLVSAGIRG